MSKQAGWSVYIVRCADGTLYTGSAKDVPARIAQHNAGRGAKYTRGRLPVALAYREAAPDRGSAQRREHQIKQMNAAEKQGLIARARASQGLSPRPRLGGPVPPRTDPAR